MENTEKQLKNLFEISKKISVPAYQRAYAWEEKQLKQFIDDLLEMKDKDYYYGHFILEQKQEQEQEFEVIDGQQRLTTFILFLMVCDLFTKEQHTEYINKFETVVYDQGVLKEIQDQLKNKDNDWELSDFEIKEENQTLSIKRILFALNFFKKALKEQLQAQAKEIGDYVNTLLNAHISTHITFDKAVAVQVFELQNTRGISLSLIEKVKAKLMKAVYLQDSNSEETIKKIQDNFAEIYKLEEQTSESSFRGDLPLEEILNYHLRVMDDGSKLTPKKQNDFRQPSTNNREESILEYLDAKIKESKCAICYIVNLVESFKQTVKFLSSDLKELDGKNKLIGDVIILNKTYSIQLFILIYHKFKNNASKFFADEKTLKLWERLLFTSDFHWEYYGRVNRDDYERLYTEIAKEKEINKVKCIICKFVEEGFRKDLFKDNNLQKTVSKFVADEKDKILTKAYHFFIDKMVYILYKYEIDQKANLEQLRKIMKDGRSIEHILPQEWQWEWIGENPQNGITDKGQKFSKSIDTVINGLGNLLLVTPNENSRENNSHPKDKEYKSCSGGSYQKHIDSKNDWSASGEWKKKIEERGEKIYEFMLDYFQLQKQSNNA